MVGAPGNFIEVVLEIRTSMTRSLDPFLSLLPDSFNRPGVETSHRINEIFEVFHSFVNISFVAESIVGSLFV